MPAALAKVEVRYDTKFGEFESTLLGGLCAQILAAGDEDATDSDNDGGATKLSAVGRPTCHATPTHPADSKADLTRAMTLLMVKRLRTEGVTSFTGPVAQAERLFKTLSGVKCLLVTIATVDHIHRPSSTDIPSSNAPSDALGGLDPGSEPSHIGHTQPGGFDQQPPWHRKRSLQQMLRSL